ncbi:MAG: discoidin domain-containing protein [Clostridia bacterium]|nr:discoidin domain-containing protein [Clostridia bacterium]
MKTNIIKKLIITVFCLTALCALFMVGTVMAADAPTIYFSNGFDTYVDGTIPVSTDTTSGVTQITPSTHNPSQRGTNGVVTVSEGNKALWFGNKNEEGYWGYTNSNGMGLKEDKQIIFSASYMSGDKPLDVLFRIAGTSGSTFLPYKIENGAIIVHGTTKIGTISKNKFTKIDVVADFAKMSYKVYVDGRDSGVTYKIACNINVPVKNVVIEPYNVNEESSIYLDELFVYTGNKFIDFPKEKFNPDSSDVPAATLRTVNYALMNQKNPYYGTNGNYALRYNSNVFVTQINGATYTSYGEQDGDIISINRFDGNNPYRGNDYITMRKEGNYATTIQFRATFGTAKARYYSMTMRLSSDNLPSMAEVFRLYGYASYDDTYRNINQLIMTLDNDGNLVTYTGVKVGKVTKGEFLEFTYAIDMYEHKIDIYVGDELKAEDIPFDSRMNNLYGLWLTIPANSSDGSIIIDGIMYNRLIEPYSPDGNFMSVYPENEYYEADLEGKYAVQGYMGTYFSETGSKQTIKDLYFFDSDSKDYKNIYLTKETMAEVLKINAADIEYKSDSKVVYKGTEYDLGVDNVTLTGSTLASFGPFAEKVLGMDVIYYEDMGMVLAGKELNINPDNERAINDGNFNDGRDTILMGMAKYMHFERPDIETMKADYYSNGNFEHPRVGITKAEIENLKVARRTDTALDEMIKVKMRFADANLHVVPTFDIDRTIRGLNSVVILPMSNRIEACAISYWMTGEQKYVDCAWAQFEEIKRWQDWNECHEIDMGRILAAMGYLYDWFYDAWTPEQRAEIIAVTERLAVIPTLDHVSYQNGDNGTQWVYELSNFNAMCSGGSMVWLAATAGECTDLTWLLGAEAGVRGGEYFLQSHMPDGTTGDSPSYWKEDMFYAMGVLSLDQVFGTTYGIKESPGLKNTSDWIISMEHPAGINPMHDTPGFTTVGDHMQTQALGIYAEIYNNPDWYAYRAYAQKNANYDDVYSYDIVCYTPGGSIDFVKLDMYAEGFQTFSAKGSTTDPASLFLSAHGGSINGFHHHEDVGTFVYLNNGVGWATELRTEDYFVNSAVKEPMFFERVESHNAMMFNPTIERMKVARGMTNTVKGAGAEVLNYVSKERGSYIIYDLSEVYANDTKQYHRGISTADDRRSAVIRDEFTVSNKVNEGWWFMNTTADDFELIDKNTLLMKKGEEQQIFELYTDLTDYEIMIIEAQTMWPELNIQDSDVTKDFERVAIKFKANANATHYIHVKMYDPTEYGLDKTDKLNRPMSQWTIPDGALTKREAFDYISYVTDDGLVGNLSTITYLQGTKKPQITKVNLVDEAMSYDIIENADSTTIRIYSANDKTVYRDRTVKYVYGEPIRTLDMYPDGTFHEYAIAGATEEATHSTAVSIDAIFDNSYSTRWGAANIGDYAVIDLGKPVEVTHFASAQWEGNTRIFRYQVLASNDGVNFTPVKNVETALGLDGIDGIMQVWEIVPTTARYFKILNTGGNTVTDAQNIYEFRLLKKN